MRKYAASSADGVLKKPFEASVVLETVKPLARRGRRREVAPRTPLPPKRPRPGRPRAGADPELVRAAVTIALDAAMPGLIDEITAKGAGGPEDKANNFMPDNTFDVVSKIELPEVSNAIQQALKEISQRYDLKNSKSNIELNEKDKKIVLTSQDEFKLKAVNEILRPEAGQAPGAAQGPELRHDHSRRRIHA